MNCEQVEELLSAYLDDMLAVGETAESAYELKIQIEAHLEHCIQCSTMLADFRRFDNLLAHLPRVSADPALHDKIFSSPKYLELTGTTGTYDIPVGDSDKQRTMPYKKVRRDTPGRPYLVALPGGRRPFHTSHTSSTSSSQPETSSSTPRINQQLETMPLPSARQKSRSGRSGWALRVMQVAIVAALLLTLGVGSLIGWNMWLQQTRPATSDKGITPPAGLPSHAPLSAGMHFVFLRDGALWSIPADGSTHAEQLTPQNVSIAANWVVSPPLPGRSAGDMLAYIDLQQAFVHTLRSDGQRDSIVQQPLLKAGVTPASVWDTDTGAAILNSLAWSKDGSMLAFVADPTGTGFTGLYILSTATGTVQKVPLLMKGRVSHPVWSPDGIRIAFELTNNGTVSILDYNTQNHGLLVITSSVSSQTYPKDGVLTLDWSPNTDTPAITWSVGVSGHVHSIWEQHVGLGGTAAPRLLLRGDYVQAIYSQNGHGGVGSWLVVTSFAGHPANLLRLDVTPGTFPIALTRGKQVNFAEWSSDGTQVDYLDSVSSHVGALHIVNATTIVDRLIATKVTNEPAAPAWSTDGQQLVYSTGTQTIVVTVDSGKLQPLNLHGLASVFVWSPDSPRQLVVVVSDGQQGVYLVDTQRNTVLQVDQQNVSGPILWSEVP